MIAHAASGSPVTRITLAPTATQSDADEQETPLNCPTFPGNDTCDQVVPPSVLTIAAPAPPDVAPTATHREELGQAAPDNAPMSDGTASSRPVGSLVGGGENDPAPRCRRSDRGARHRRRARHREGVGHCGVRSSHLPTGWSRHRELRGNGGAHGAEGADEDRRTARTRDDAFESTNAPSFGVDRPIGAPSRNAAHTPRRLSHRCLTSTSVDRHEEPRNNRHTEDRQSARPCSTEHFTVQTPDVADHKRRQQEEQQEDNNYLCVVYLMVFDPHRRQRRQK